MKFKKKQSSSPPVITFRNVLPEDWILATRAATWMLMHPNQKDVILQYGDGITLWVEWTPARNIIVRGPILNAR